MDDSLNDDGYVSIWDISNRTSPKFLKRLKPGKERADDYKMTHELYSTMDAGPKFVYAQSWGSGHLVEIDASTDEVIKAVVGKRMPDGTCPTATLFRGH